MYVTIADNNSAKIVEFKAKQFIVFNDLIY